MRLLGWAPLLILMLLGGCAAAPEPAAVPPVEQPLPRLQNAADFEQNPAHKAPFGRYNIHKRNGLGAWEKPGHE